MARIYQCMSSRTGKYAGTLVVLPLASRRDGCCLATGVSDLLDGILALECSDTDRSCPGGHRTIVVRGCYILEATKCLTCVVKNLPRYRESKIT